MMMAMMATMMMMMMMMMLTVVDLVVTSKHPSQTCHVPLYHASALCPRVRSVETYS